jgi:hypothetical protein
MKALQLAYEQAGKQVDCHLANRTGGGWYGSQADCTLHEAMAHTRASQCHQGHGFRDSGPA